MNSMRGLLSVLFLCAGAGFALSSSKSVTGNVVGYSNSASYFSILGFIFLLAGLALLLSGKSLRSIVNPKKD